MLQRGGRKPRRAFSTTSLLCALAWSIEALVAFRVLQGVGGGMLSLAGAAVALLIRDRDAAATMTPRNSVAGAGEPEPGPAVVH